MISGTILHYEILEKLGEGGMGEVYKARDTKLDRLVALKFLPSNLTATEVEKARFIQEAKAASALNHPNICTIFDIQEHEGQLFIVMEYVDGETLRHKKQSFSTKQVVEIGAQAADGLAEAHDKGIVHRDIKPENIMMSKNGIVKLMDFGLAKLNKAEEASRLTKAGMTLGTVGYMSPEQVQGQDVDGRSDIFSLGVVLYELLSGESPFKGVHETAIMYEIVNVDPEPVSAKKEGIDPELDRILFECLDKEKEERYQSAHELSKDLKRFRRDSGRQRIGRMSNAHVPLDSSQSRRPTGAHQAADMPLDSSPRGIFGNTRMLVSTSAVLLAAVAAFIAFFVLGRSGDNQPEIKATILPPREMTLDNAEGSNVSISPNGKFIVFVADDSSGNSKLWLRAINSLKAVPLASVDNAAYPFWSPDSRYVAYFSGGKLMKMSLGDKIAVALCDAPSGRGGTWGKNGDIVFSPEPTSGLDEISSQGGEPKVVVKQKSGVLSLRWPYFLPDGKHFLYSTQHSESGSSPMDAIFVTSLDGGQGKELLRVSSNAEYADGYLFYVRQSILLAQKFDPGNLDLSEDSKSLAENVQYFDVRISGTFSVSPSGMLVYEEKNPNNEKVVLLDRKGKIVKTVLNSKIWNWASFSPNGRKIAFDYYDPSAKNIDVWTYDIGRGVLTRLTFSTAADVFPIWSPDGQRIAFSSDRTTTGFGCFEKNADGSGEATLICKVGDQAVLTGFSRDGKYALLMVADSAGGGNRTGIWVQPLTGDKKPVPYLTAKYSAALPVFSPDMKWVAYMSNESGKYQVYVAPFGSGSGKWQVSVNGGGNPQWMDGGKKLYFFTPTNRIMSVDVNESGSSISPGEPHLVFSAHSSETSLLAIDASGSEILAEVPKGKVIPSPITLVSNWQKELGSK